MFTGLTELGYMMVYPLVMTNSLLLKMAIEIVDFPMKHGGSFHSYVKLPVISDLLEVFVG